jgi:hypothetical protein
VGAAAATWWLPPSCLRLVEQGSIEVWRGGLLHAHMFAPNKSRKMLRCVVAHRWMLTGVPPVWSGVLCCAVLCYTVQGA